jgi:predicted MFS family arabinose efflux permease
MSMAASVTRLLIPATTGVLIAVIGPGSVGMLAGASLFAGVLAALAIDVPPRQTRSIDPKSAYADIVQAARFVWSDKALLGFTIVTMAPLLFITPINMGLMPVFASEVFGGGPEVLGLLISTLGAGMTLGTIVLASVGDVRNKGPVTLLFMVGMAVGLAAFSRAGNLPIAIAILLPYSAIMVVFWTVAGAAVQTIVPDELRGRVTSLGMLTHVALPVGSLVIGGIAQVLGVQMATAVSAAGLLTFAVASRFLLPAMCQYRSRYSETDDATETEDTEVATVG